MQRDEHGVGTEKCHISLTVVLFFPSPQLYIIASTVSVDGGLQEDWRGGWFHLALLSFVVTCSVMWMNPRDNISDPLVRSWCWQFCDWEDTLSLRHSEFICKTRPTAPVVGRNWKPWCPITGPFYLFFSPSSHSVTPLIPILQAPNVAQIRAFQRPLSWVARCTPCRVVHVLVPMNPNSPVTVPTRQPTVWCPQTQRVGSWRGKQLWAVQSLSFF